MTHSSKKQPVPPAQAKLIPPETRTVFEKFIAKNLEIYLVGAGVRQLLNRQVPYDCDFTTNANPEVIQSLFADSFYDNDYGTVSIPTQTDRGDEVYEITPYRTEWGYTDQRRPDGVRWGDNLEEDLQRRDFTFNAIVIGPKKDRGRWDGKKLELIDLFDGRKDFKNRIVRAVGNPDKRFGEDALRMMRAVRFAAQLGFTIEEKTFAAIRKNAPLVKKISAERVRNELLKILASDYPMEGYQFLRSSGLAEIILPEVEATFGVGQKSPNRHHIYDVGTHSLLSLKNCPSEDPIVRLAVLLHDIGKPPTRQVEADSTVTFYNHEIVGTDLAYNIGRRLKLSKKDLVRLTKLVRWHQFTVTEKQTDKAIRRFIRSVGINNVQDMLDLRTGDRIGGGARETSWRLEDFKKRLIEVQKTPFTVKDLKIDGHDIMKELGLKPGPKIGELLETLFELVEEKKIKNTRPALIKKLQEIGGKK